MIDILIAHAGLSPELNEKAVRCLQSIREHSEDYRIIFVDNGSADTLAIETELGKHDRVIFLRNDVNVGFVDAMNQAIGISDTPLFVLLNNDCEVAAGWLEKLQEPFAYPFIGLVGPLTTTPNSWQGRWSARGGWTLLPPGRMLAFFCVMIRREVIDHVGFAHDDFALFGGFGGDDWLCCLAEHHGWRLALAQDLVIPHGYRSTFETLHSNASIKEMQRLAINLFREKRMALKGCR